MENYLNLKKLTAGEPYAKYRMALWIYLFLLIFEGALRKWFYNHWRHHCCWFEILL